MVISDDVRTHYEEVLRDLHTRRNEQARLLAEIDQTIASIKKLIQPETASVPSPTLPFSPPLSRTTNNPTRFAGMSVRWAILLLLETASSPMSTSEIAEALLAGGMITRASNFNNNVSAVLSDMKNVRREVEIDATDAKWRITDNGRSAATHIRTHRLGR